MLGRPPPVGATSNLSEMLRLGVTLPFPFMFGAMAVDGPAVSFECPICGRELPWSERYEDEDTIGPMVCKDCKEKGDEGQV